MAGRSFIVAGLGTAGNEVADAWEAVIRAHGAPLRRLADGRAGENAQEGDGKLVPHLGAALAEARVGVRLMLAGPEVDVLVLNARALEAGMLPCEMRLHATATDVRRIRCAHCSAVFTARVQALGGVTCAGCGLDLIVQPHLSRHHGAYQGYWTRVEPGRPA